MKIYNYHPMTGVLIGEGLADESPLEPGVFLIPDHATTEPPPETKDNEYAAFVFGAWVIGVVEPDAEPEPHIKTQAEKIANLERALDRHLDAVAQGYRFSDRTRLALRAAYPNAWQALGTDFGTWMDACNALVAAGLAEVIAGERLLPTEEEMLAGLPAFEFAAE